MARAVVFPKPEQVELKDFEPAALAADQVRLRTVVSLISAGTETRCLRGNYAPGSHWDNWIKYPFYPGYASVGIIEEVGSDVDNLAVGQMVATRKGHRSHHVISADGVTPVPQSLPVESAVWLAMAKIAFMGNLAAQCKQGSRVVIIGAGPIGQMSLRWARCSGAKKTVVIDTEQFRLDLAMQSGADAVVCGPAGDHIEQVQEYFGSAGGPDTVIDTTGNPAAFTAAMAIAARFGRVVVLGDVGDPDSQHLSSDLIIKGLSIVGAHDCHSGGDWPQERVFELFFHHCLSGQMDMSNINTHFFAPDEAPKAYQAAGSQGKSMGVIFKWS